MHNTERKDIWVVTISPNSRTFSPRTINTPQGMSQYMSSTILRSKVDWRTRFAGEIKKEIHIYVVRKGQDVCVVGVQTILLSRVRVLSKALGEVWVLSYLIPSSENANEFPAITEGDE